MYTYLSLAIFDPKCDYEDADHNKFHIKFNMIYFSDRDSLPNSAMIATSHQNILYYS